MLATSYLLLVLTESQKTPTGPLSLTRLLLSLPLQNISAGFKERWSLYLHVFSTFFQISPPSPALSFPPAPAALKAGMADACSVKGGGRPSSACLCLGRPPGSWNINGQESLPGAGSLRLGVGGQEGHINILDCNLLLDNPPTPHVIG